MFRCSDRRSVDISALGWAILTLANAFAYLLACRAVYDEREGLMRELSLALAIAVLAVSAPARADIVVPKRKIIPVPHKAPSKARRPSVSVHARLRISGYAGANGVTLKIPRHVLRALAKKDARRHKQKGAGLLTAPWGRPHLRTEGPAGPAGVAFGLGLLMLGVLLTLQMLLREYLRRLRARLPLLGACVRSWLAPAALSLVTLVAALVWTTRAQADAASYEAIGMTHRVEVVVEPPLSKAASIGVLPRVTIIAPRRTLARSCARHMGN